MNTNARIAIRAVCCMIRRRVAEVKDDLPEKVREIVPLDLSRPKEYAEARDNFIVWLKKNKPGKAARAAHFTQLGYLLRLCAELKLGGVVDWANHWLDNSEPDRKLVLFGIHKKMLAALHERVKAKSLVIDGSVTGKKRKQAVDQFRNDNSVRVAIVNIKAMGTGVDGLQERANVMAFTEMGLVPAWHDQAESPPCSPNTSAGFSDDRGTNRQSRRRHHRRPGDRARQSAAVANGRGPVDGGRKSLHPLPIMGEACGVSVPCHQTGRTTIQMPKRQLFPYQKEGVRQVERWGLRTAILRRAAGVLGLGVQGSHSAQRTAQEGHASEEGLLCRTPGQVPGDDASRD